MKCSFSMIPWQFFTMLANYSILYVLTFFGFCDGFCDTDSTGGEHSYHDSVSVIVPRFTSFAEDFVLYCCQVTILFWSLCSNVVKSPYFSHQRIDLFVFCGSKHEHCASVFCISTFEASAFRNWIRSFRGMCEHMRLQILWINCEGLQPNVNALRWIFLVHPRLLVHGSPWPACHDLSASVSRMHACHFELLLDLIMFPIFWNYWTARWSRCWRQHAAGTCGSLDTTISTELSIVQVIVFSFLVNRRFSPFSTHMNIRVLSKV